MCSQNKQEFILAVILPSSVFFVLVTSLTTYHNDQISPLDYILVVLRSIIDVYDVFMGSANTEIVSMLDSFSNDAVIYGFRLAYWVSRTVIIFTLISFALTIFARKLVDSCRVELYTKFRKNRLYLILNADDNALSLAESIRENDKKDLPVLYCEKYDAELREKLAERDCVLQELVSRPKHVEKYTTIEFESTKYVKTEGIRTSINQLLARKMILENQPYKQMEFHDALATKSFSALIVGFGDLGRECARQLIYNAQFLTQEGEQKPKIAIVDNMPVQFDKFQVALPEINKCAKIGYFELDAYSLAFATKLRELADSEVGLNCIIIALKDNDASLKVKNIVERELKRAEIDLELLKIIIPSTYSENVFTSKIILHHELDKQAIEINATYAEVTDEQEKLKKWKELSEFHKDSSRASADFMQPIHALKNSNATLSVTELNQNLAHTEHLRWNAFHFCNGYTTMDDNMYQKRLKLNNTIHADDKTFKPAQNHSTLQHYLLIPWDELNEKEKQKDYRIVELLENMK
jgi:hypothetical protein